MSRIPFPSVGKYRFRDALRVKDGGIFIPVLKFSHPKTGGKITLLPVPVASSPRFFREVEAMGAEHAAVMQVGSTNREVITPTESNYWPDVPSEGKHTVIPSKWDVPSASLHGIDTSEGKMVTDWYATFGGHFFPNFRALENAKNMQLIIETNGYSSALAPVWATHYPTHAKFLLDIGYQLEGESEIPLIRPDEVSTSTALTRVNALLKSLQLNNYSSDFIPVCLVLFLYFTFSGRRENREGGQGGYPGNYPPQGGYQQGYPQQGGYPQGAYPPPQVGYQQQGGGYDQYSQVQNMTQGGQIPPGYPPPPDYMQGANTNQYGYQPATPPGLRQGM